MMKSDNKGKPPIVLTVAVAILVAVMAACTASTPQPEGQVVEAPQEVQRVTLEESKAAFDSGSAVFLDVRSEDAYEASHIPGAVSIPLQFLEPRLAELDPDQWIITYCA